MRRTGIVAAGLATAIMASSCLDSISNDVDVGTKPFDVTGSIQTNAPLTFPAPTNLGNIQVDFLGENPPPTTTTAANGTFAQTNFPSGTFEVVPSSPVFDFYLPDPTFLTTADLAQSVDQDASDPTPLLFEAVPKGALIDLWSPNGGEALRVGTDVQITWNLIGPDPTDLSFPPFFNDAGNTVSLYFQRTVIALSTVTSVGASLDGSTLIVDTAQAGGFGPTRFAPSLADPNGNPKTLLMLTGANAGLHVPIAAVSDPADPYPTYDPATGTFALGLASFPNAIAPGDQYTITEWIPITPPAGLPQVQGQNGYDWTIPSQAAGASGLSSTRIRIQSNLYPSVLLDQSDGQFSVADAAKVVVGVIDKNNLLAIPDVQFQFQVVAGVNSPPKFATPGELTGTTDGGSATTMIDASRIGEATLPIPPIPPPLTGMFVGGILNYTVSGTVYTALITGFNNTTGEFTLEDPANPGLGDPLPTPVAPGEAYEIVGFISEPGWLTGTYTVTPVKAGFTFTPVNVTIDIPNPASGVFAPVVFQGENTTAAVAIQEPVDTQTLVVNQTFIIKFADTTLSLVNIGLDLNGDGSLQPAEMIASSIDVSLLDTHTFPFTPSDSDAGVNIPLLIESIAPPVSDVVNIDIVFNQSISGFIRNGEGSGTPPGLDALVSFSTGESVPLILSLTSTLPKGVYNQTGFEPATWTVSPTKPNFEFHAVVGTGSVTLPPNGNGITTFDVAMNPGSATPATGMFLHFLSGAGANANVTRQITGVASLLITLDSSLPVPRTANELFEISDPNQQTIDVTVVDGSDVTDVNFHAFPLAASITVQQPNGGDFLPRSGSSDIVVNAAGTFADFSGTLTLLLEFSLNGGASWLPVAGGGAVPLVAGGNATFSWNLLGDPNVSPSSNDLVRATVNGFAPSRYSDVSDAAFSITFQSIAGQVRTGDTLATGTPAAQISFLPAGAATPVLPVNTDGAGNYVRDQVEPDTWTLTPSLPGREFHAIVMTGSVTAVTSPTALGVSLTGATPPVAGQFMHIRTGINAGASRRIQSYNAGTSTISFTEPLTVSLGAQIEISDPAQSTLTVVFDGSADVASADFRAFPQGVAITVVAPNGGEFIARDGTFDIEVNTNGLVSGETVALEYTLDALSAVPTWLPVPGGSSLAAAAVINHAWNVGTDINAANSNEVQVRATVNAFAPTRYRDESNGILAVTSQNISGVVRDGDGDGFLPLDGIAGEQVGFSGATLAPFPAPAGVAPASTTAGGVFTQSGFAPANWTITPTPSSFEFHAVVATGSTTVSGVSDDIPIAVTGAVPAAGMFLHFTNGSNADRSRQIQGFAGGIVTLVEPFLLSVGAGDAFEITDPAQNSIAVAMDGTADIANVNFHAYPVGASVTVVAPNGNAFLPIDGAFNIAVNTSGLTGETIALEYTLDGINWQPITGGLAAAATVNFNWDLSADPVIQAFGRSLTARVRARAEGFAPSRYRDDSDTDFGITFQNIGGVIRDGDGVNVFPTAAPGRSGVQVGFGAAVLPPFSFPSVLPGVATSGGSGAYAQSGFEPATWTLTPTAPSTDFHRVVASGTVAVSGSVQDVPVTFSVAFIPSPGQFLHFIAGANLGHSRQIQSYNIVGGTVRFFEPLPAGVGAGDQFEITAPALATSVVTLDGTSDFLSENFHGFPAGVTLTVQTPNGGDFLASSGSFDIIVNTSGLNAGTHTLRLEYSLDSTAASPTWFPVPLGSALPATAAVTHTWNLAADGNALPSTFVRVRARVNEFAPTRYEDTSDDHFSITIQTISGDIRLGDGNGTATPPGLGGVAVTFTPAGIPVATSQGSGAWTGVGFTPNTWTVDPSFAGFDFHGVVATGTVGIIGFTNDFLIAVTGTDPAPGMTIHFLTGPNQGRSRIVAGYNSGTQIITLAEPLTNPTTNSDTFEISDSGSATLDVPFTGAAAVGGVNFHAYDSTASVSFTAPTASDALPVAGMFNIDVSVTGFSAADTITLEYTLNNGVTWILVPGGAGLPVGGGTVVHAWDLSAITTFQVAARVRATVDQFAPTRYRVESANFPITFQRISGNVRIGDGLGGGLLGVSLGYSPSPAGPTVPLQVNTDVAGDYSQNGFAPATWTIIPGLVGAIFNPVVAAGSAATSADQTFDVTFTSGAPTGGMYLHVLSGPNAGVARLIGTVTGTSVTLVRNLPAALIPGDTFEVTDPGRNSVDVVVDGTADVTGVDFRSFPSGVLLNVTAPDSADFLALTSPFQVVVATSGLTDGTHTLSLEFTTDGTNWFPIGGATGLPLSGGTATFNWTAGNDTAFEGGGVQVRAYVDQFAPSRFTGVSQGFSIADLQIVFPDAALPPEGWPVDRTQDILWSASGLTEFAVHLSVDGGGSFPFLLGTVSGTTRLTFTPTTGQGGSVREIRVSNNAGGSGGQPNVISAQFPISELEVTGPNAADVFAPGSNQTISWLSSVNFGTVRVEYSQTSPTGPWTLITVMPAGTGLTNLPWAVPPGLTPGSSNTWVRVAAATTFDSLPADVSDAFSISSITVTSPNGLETWPMESSQDITWTQGGLTGNVTIEVAPDGVTFSPIATVPATDLSYTWNPVSLVTGTGSTNAKVRIHPEFSQFPSDESNAPFTVSSIEVTSPDSGTTWTQGLQTTAIWNNVGMTGAETVAIDLYDNTSTFVETISAGTPNTGSFTWVTGPTSAGNRFVRIRELSTGFPTDDSPLFTVQTPQVSLISPAGGEVFFVGQTISILYGGDWDGGGTQEVDIYWTNTTNPLLTETWIANAGNLGADEDIEPDGTMDIFRIVDGATDPGAGNTASFNWMIPASAIGTTIRVFVEDGDSGNRDPVRLSGFFEVRGGSVTLTNPVGGETWYQGATETISWTSVAVTNVDLHYTIDNSNFTLITTVPASGGTYNWTLPLTLDSTTVQVRVSESGGGTSDISPVFTVAPVDVIITADDPAATEGGDTGAFRVLRTGSTTGALVVNLSRGGTATLTADYTDGLGGTTVTIPDGAGSVPITITPVNNGSAEPDETVIYTLGGGTGYAVGSPSSATVTIVDDDTVNITIDDVTQAEGNAGTSIFSFTLTLSATAATSINVDYTTLDVTAAAGSDYVTAAGTATVTAGATTTTIDVTVNGDTAQEGDEGFIVVLSNPTIGTITDGIGVGTITGDDGPPVVSIGNASVAENSGTLSLTVSLSKVFGSNITVDFAVTDGTATTADSDYVNPAPTSVTVLAGMLSATIDIALTGDTKVELDETLTVTISNPTAGAILGTAVGTGTITNDDATTVSIDTPAGIAEGNGGTKIHTFTISIPTAAGVDITVDFTTVDGSATTADGDYVFSSSTATIIAGNTSVAVAITTNTDALHEVDETFTVVISNPTIAAVSVGTATGTGTINNDDAAPSVSIDSPNVAEGNAGTTALTFTVSLSAVSGVDITVDIASADVETTAGTDYVTITATQVTVPAGSPSATLNVDVNGDTLYELDETFTVTISNPTNGATLGTAVGTGTITDDDAAPAISINTPAGIPEGNAGTSILSFTVSIPAAAGTDISVNYTTSDVDTTAGTDYVTASGTATIPAGSTTATIDVTVNGDTDVEADETFEVTISGPTPAAVTIGTAVGTGTIQDDGD